MMTRTPPAGFRHSTPMTIRFADMDAMGHVNNAKYLTYLETGRISYVHEVCGIDFSTRTNVILAKITVEYMLPLVLGDPIAVYTRCSRMGNRSFDLEALIMRYKDDDPPAGQVAAQGVAVMVAYDYTANQTILIPGEWRERIMAYEPTLTGIQ